jgi:hypothetical protein
MFWSLQVRLRLCLMEDAMPTYNLPVWEVPLAVTVPHPYRRVMLSGRHPHLPVMFPTNVSGSRAAGTPKDMAPSSTVK